MTLIVASLFLPYTVEFEIDNINPDLIDSLPIKQVRNSFSGTTTAVNHTQTSDSNNEIATDSKLDGHAIAQATNTNLAALATSPTTSLLQKKIGIADDFKTTNSSVEDFFYQSASYTPIESPTSAANLKTSVGSDAHFNDELKSKLNNLSSPYSKSTGNLPFSLKRNSSSVFVPKSRVGSPPINSIKSDQRIPTKNKPYQGSNLKSGHGKGLEKQPVIINNDDEGFDGFSDDDYDFDQSANSRQLHRIPKFGGFSKKDPLSSISTDANDSSNIFNDSSFEVVPFSKGNGALKNAITSTLPKNSYKWLGTIGIPTDQLPSKVQDDIVTKLSTDYASESVLPSDYTFQGHYKNFCKQILWPTLHYQIPDNPNSKAFEDNSWEFYKQLNQDFADKVVEIYQEGDVIWVHDYHLLLLPQMIRAKLPNAKIGFFLHVSFPSSEVFRCFAQRESLLKGILGANYVSFQTDEYVRHFGQTCNKLLLADISRDEIRYEGSTIKIGSSPVGIDADVLLKQVKDSSTVTNWRQLIKQRWPTQKLIVSRDQFDQIRGLKQKLLAYERFLQENPEYIDKAVLIQICMKSSKATSADFKKYESQIMLIVDRINSLSPNISSNCQPVVFLHLDIEFVQYLALLAEADSFIVNSMREGMNLTSHEFIVATYEKKSPLILSEFTGSASVFNKGFFKINPWDIRQVSHAIKDSLELDYKTKESNWEYLFKLVKNQNGQHWVKINLQNIEDSWKHQLEKSQIHSLNVGLFTKAYRSAKDGKRLFVIHLPTNIPINERILKNINDLATNNEVYIFSDHKKNQLDRAYRLISSKIGLIAENGGLIRLSNQNDWISLVDTTKFKKWLKILRNALEAFEERLPRSFIEIGETFLKFHTEQVLDIDSERKAALIGDLVAHVNDLTYHDNDDSSEHEASTFEEEEDDNFKIHATVSDDIVYVQTSDIAPKSIKFLIEYYSKPNKAEILDHFNADIITPPSPITSTKQSNKAVENSEYFIGIDLLTVAGNGDILFEPIFEYVNELSHEDSSSVGQIYSIGYGDNGNSGGANDQIDGLNELFNVFRRLV